jgi:hypothetical protein
MQRETSDIYIGAAVVIAALGVIALLFKATIAFIIFAVGVWVYIALRFWRTNVGFGMLLGACMFPPLIFLLFVRPQSIPTYEYNTIRDQSEHKH